VGFQAQVTFSEDFEAMRNGAQARSATRKTSILIKIDAPKKLPAD
jgi:hypothetical protein